LEILFPDYTLRITKAFREYYMFIKREEVVSV
jgi:hypothetical protein